MTSPPVLDGLLWSWPLTFDLQNLIRLSVGEVSSRLLKLFMKYRGTVTRSVQTKERTRRTDKQNGFADTVRWLAMAKNRQCWFCYVSYQYNDHAHYHIMLTTSFQWCPPDTTGLGSDQQPAKISNNNRWIATAVIPLCVSACVASASRNVIILR